MQGIAFLYGWIETTTLAMHERLILSVFFLHSVEHEVGALQGQEQDQ